MAICAPSGYLEWAESSASRRYSWGMFGYYFAFCRARDAAKALHPAAVTAAKAAVCAFNPAGCNCNPKLSGPFELTSSSGFFRGSVTVFIRTQIKGIYECDSVPEDAMEYKIYK